MELLVGTTVIFYAMVLTMDQTESRGMQKERTPPCSARVWAEGQGPRAQGPALASRRYRYGTTQSLDMRWAQGAAWAPGDGVTNDG